MGKLIIQVRDLKSLIKERYLVRPHNRRYNRRAIAYAYKARQRGLTPEQMMAAANQMNNNPFSSGSNDFRRGADLNIELGRLERDKRQLEIQAFKTRTDPVVQQNIKNRMNLINKRLDENVITLGQLGGYGMPKQGNSVDLDYENDGSFIGDNNTEITSGSQQPQWNYNTGAYTYGSSVGSSDVGSFVPQYFNKGYTTQNPFNLSTPVKMNKMDNPLYSPMSETEYEAYDDWKRKQLKSPIMTADEQGAYLDWINQADIIPPASAPVIKENELSSVVGDSVLKKEIKKQRALVEPEMMYPSFIPDEIPAPIDEVPFEYENPFYNPVNTVAPKKRVRRTKAQIAEAKLFMASQAPAKRGRPKKF